MTVGEPLRSTPRSRAGIGVPLIVLLFLLGLAACQSGDDGDEARAPPVVAVTAVDYAFQAPDSIPSGWTTFRMKNEGEETHHFHLYLLPEEKRLEDFQKDYATPLDSLLHLLLAGRIDSAEAGAIYEKRIRDWARPANLEKRGGMGAVAPGRTGQATVRLDPGTYVMDCAVRNPDGKLHRALGMILQLTVTETSTGASPPEADLTVRVSGKHLRFDSTLTAGTQTLRFEVDSVPAGVDSAYFATPARLGPDTDVADLRQWVEQGLPYPVPVETLGASSTWRPTGPCTRRSL